MIESCFKLRDVFVAMPNSDEVSHLLDLSNLCELAWRHLYGISRFLQPAAEVVELSSSSTNIAASIQVRILKRLAKHCDDSIADPDAINSTKLKSTSLT